MSKGVGSLVFILSVVACGGSTDIGEEPGAGSSPGGSSQAGKSNGGSSSGGAAGKSTGGSVSMAGSDVGGAAGVGGTIIVVGGYGGAVTGGTGSVDPRCPDFIPNPSGACEDAGLMCEYDFNGCLCYPQGPVGYGFCQKVDPMCVGGPVPPAPPPDAGAGGFTTKIALPPRRVCTCSASIWACTYGF